MEFNTSIFAKYLRSLYKVNLNKSNLIHKVIIDAVFKMFIQMEDDLNQMALELSLRNSTGNWLNLWGEYFGIPRIFGEPDEIYSSRIITEIIEPKATLDALKQATANWLNRTYEDSYSKDDIEVFEPWTNLLVTSQRGKISQFGRLPDSKYWTPGVVDLAVPDSSEMSEVLITYLNTIKAAGVQLTWHRSMNWSIVTGYFESDSIEIDIQRYFDMWIKREENIRSGFYTSSKFSSVYEYMNSPLSVKGKISGEQITYFEIETFRDLSPYRLTNTVVSYSPIIKLQDVSEVLGVSVDNLTVKNLSDAGLNSDRQIPNLSNSGKLYLDEVRKYLEKDVGELNRVYAYSTIEELNSEFGESTIEEIGNRFLEDTESLETFLTDWGKFEYINQPLTIDRLSNSSGVLEIDTAPIIPITFGVLRPYSLILNWVRRFMNESEVEETLNSLHLNEEQFSFIGSTFSDNSFRELPNTLVTEIFYNKSIASDLDEVDKNTVLDWCEYGDIFNQMLGPIEISVEPVE